MSLPSLKLQEPGNNKGSDQKTRIRHQNFGECAFNLTRKKPQNAVFWLPIKTRRLIKDGVRS
jgi:hypothetical protein